jgi:serine/threonine-protein kinase HipA
LRNHGFLHVHDDVWRLSPAFDINPNPDPAATNLRTMIDDTRSDLDVGLVLEVAELFRLGPPEAKFVMDEVVAAVSEWRNVAQRHELSGSEISQMTPAFSALKQLMGSPH